MNLAVPANQGLLTSLPLISGKLHPSSSLHLQSCSNIIIIIMNIANIMNLRFIKHGSRSVNVQQLNKKQANKKEEKKQVHTELFLKFLFPRATDRSACQKKFPTTFNTIVCFACLCIVPCCVYVCRGHSKDWYLSVFGRVCASHVLQIRDSLRSDLDSSDLQS